MSHHNLLGKRKAQISIFMIIGIVMAFVVGISYITYNKLMAQPFEEAGLRLENYPAEIRPSIVLVDNSMKACMKQSLNDGLFILGAHGGRIEVEEPAFVTEKERINEQGELETQRYEFGYGSYDNKNLLPYISTVKTDLEFYVEENIVSCSQNMIEPAKNLGTNISFKEINANIDFLNNKTSLNLKYKIELSRTDLNQEISEFYIELPIRFELVYQQANELTEQLIANPDYIQLDAISDEDIDISYVPYENDNLIYVLSDYGSRISTNLTGEKQENKPFLFAFVNKVKAENKTSLFEMNDTFLLRVGEEFEYQVETSSELETDTEFTSEGTLFEIQKDGLINFTPNEGDIGFKVIRIIATNQNISEEKEVVFIVEDVNKKPYIEEIQDQPCHVNLSCYIEINANDADGELVRLSDSSDLFDISQDGIIEFVPKEQGLFSIEITASDNKSSYTTSFNLIISELEKPKIEGPDSFTVNINELFTYDFNSKAEEESVVMYYSNESWFEISGFDGLVEFIPDQTGVFFINISAEDLYGNVDSKIIKFEVLNKTTTDEALQN